MKTVQSMDDLRRHALHNGAELEVDGRRFNSGQARVAPAPTPAAEPPAPVESLPPAAPALTREQVDGMLAARDAAWAQQLAAQAATFRQALQAMQTGQQQREPPTWEFVWNDADGNANTIIATPTPKG